MTLPAAVIFDFDGVIVDTEPLHWEAFRRLLEPCGIVITWENYLARYVGFDDRDVFRVAYKDGGLDLDEGDLPKLIEEKAGVFQALVHEQAPDPYPGAVDLIRALSGSVPLAICSGALRCDIEPILKKLGLETAFDVMVTADDVHASKPNPASYELAVQRLAEAFSDRTLDASRCVAVEDTPAGIEAARGAGLVVLALSNTYPTDALEAAAQVRDTLSGVTAEMLGGMVISA